MHSYFNISLLYTRESVAGLLADKVSGQTTGPILMPFCIQTTYWSPTWLGISFFTYYSFLDGFPNILEFHFFQNMATLHKKNGLKNRNFTIRVSKNMRSETTGPIFMPFCIKTTYWSPTWLGVFCSPKSQNMATLHTHMHISIFTP